MSYSRYQRDMFSKHLAIENLAKLATRHIGRHAFGFLVLSMAAVYTSRLRTVVLQTKHNSDAAMQRVLLPWSAVLVRSTSRTTAVAIIIVEAALTFRSEQKPILYPYSSPTTIV